jgi:hypothetical protein
MPPRPRCSTAAAEKTRGGRSEACARTDSTGGLRVGNGVASIRGANWRLSSRHRVPPCKRARQASRS